MSKTWAFELRNESGDVLDLDVYDILGSGFFYDGVTARDVLARMNTAKNATQINLRINSRGGVLDEAKAIYNLLRAKAKAGVKVSAQVDALAASAAVTVMIGADNVTVAKNARVMIHEASAGTPGRGTADDHTKVSSYIESENALLAQAYADASARRGKNKTPKEFRSKMAEETYFTAPEAVEWGLADNVGEDTAIAACAVDLSELTNAPEDFRKRFGAPEGMGRVLDARGRGVGWTAIAVAAQQPITPPDGRQTQAHQVKEKLMKNVLAILAALSISATEDQESNERAILERTKKLGQLEALTGATGEEALGTVRAWKASHTALAPISTELSALKATSEKSELTALLKQGRDEKKLTKAESDKLQAQVEGYWVARAESKEPTGDQMSLAAAKSFVAIMSPKSHLVNEPKAPPASPESVTVVGAEGIVAHNGKPYEQMVSDEHAQLRSQEGGEAIYQDLRANWKLRGSPRITQKRAS